MDARAQDLLRVLQGLARARAPGFPFLWVHISRADAPRRKFMHAREALVVSLPDGRSFSMAAGSVSGAELCELRTMVSFTVPIEPAALAEDSQAVLEDAGFVMPSV